MAAGVRWFEIPLHSSEGHILEELTGADCFRRTKKAMSVVRKAGSRLTVSHLITSRNFRHSAPAVRLALALGAEAVALNRFVPTGAGRGRPDLVPMPFQLDASLRSASEVSRRSPGIRVYTAIPVEDCLHPHESFPGIDFGSCSCGLFKWAVSPAGELRFCEQSSAVLGSLLDRSFQSLTDDPSVEEFRSATLRPDCRTCSAWACCGGGCRCMRE
jgi:radical SAM protein with 4Fe4S-binding SPASM domain